MKKYKSHIVRFCVVAMSIILILATAFIFLAFRTDYIFNIDAESTIHSAYFDRTSVSTVIEEIDRVEGAVGDLVPTVPGENPPGIPQIPTTDGWYANIDASVPTGHIVTELSGTFPVEVYDGLPWEPTGGTYIFYYYKAKEDIYSILDKAGIERKYGSRKVVNSTWGNSPVTRDADNITGLSVCVFPAMIDRGYYPSRCNVQAEGSGDGSSAVGRIKMACVVVESGKDPSDSSNYLYLPCVKNDSKAHTWYGGVVQTNVKVESENQLQIATNNSGSSYESYTIDPAKDLTTTLQEVNKIMNDNGLGMGDWYANALETYNMSSSTVSNFDNYDIVGWVVYPWPI